MQAALELAGLFLNAFVAATIIPIPSEPALMAALALGSAPGWALIAAATIGNTLGSVVNWALGRWVERFRDHPRFPVKPEDFARYAGWYRRFGVWSLLGAWLPIIGDPLTVMAGVFRTPLWLFLLVVGISKLTRYLGVAGLLTLAL
jgi:membrane protein YqaA with SNARE-associated domain